MQIDDKTAMLQILATGKTAKAKFFVVFVGCLLWCYFSSLSFSEHNLTGHRYHPRNTRSTQSDRLLFRIVLKFDITLSTLQVISKKLQN